ncbi:MAG: RluA family pseudouridine synthase [Bacilli bacterium]|nr:RluA family pseudouridine synthase [Bacilli bacterium]
MKEFVIDKNHENQRIDKYLKKLLSRASTTLIYKMIRKKDIKVNGVKVKENYILKKGDIVSMFLYEDRFKELSEPLTLYDLKIEFDVIYEDEKILIVNKPAGLLVHEDENESINTLANQVLNYLYQKGEYDPVEDIGFVPGPVHRLDRNTSGLVVFGKTMKSLQDLNEMMKKRHCIDKTYLTICKGYMDSCEMVDYVKKDADNKMMRIVSKDSDGALKMHTIVEKVKSKNNMTLLKVKLVTGRTHQIRIHLSSHNHPIIGDSKYGDFEFNKMIKKDYHLDHQFLHAYSLTFTKPIGSVKYLEGKTFITPLPKKLNQIKLSIFDE